MLRTALNKTWKQHLTNTDIYGKIQTITKSIRENSQDIAREVNTKLEAIYFFCNRYMVKDLEDYHPKRTSIN